MNLSDKIAFAHQTIEAGLAEFRRPAIMCSFGKDSMVVLDLVSQHGSFPVIFHREAMQPHKYAFANKVIHDLGLTVYDYAPVNTEVQESETEFEILSHYQIGARTCMVPTGIRAPGVCEAFACGLSDIYQKPIGQFAYPWDLVFHGHKSSDSDPVYGNIPLTSDFARNVGCASAAFPLRHFTDADIWAYTERESLPIHHERYEKTESGWREREDKHHNPDYITACVECMKKSSPVAVPCPKLNGRLVSNVSSQLRWAQKAPVTYMEPSKA